MIKLNFKYLVLSAMLLMSFPSMSDEIDDQVRLILGWLDSADANLDAQEALRNGDIRLWGVRGIMLYIPGIENDQKKVVQSLPIVKKHGFRVIKGTSDRLISKEHERLVKLANVYAKKYNQFVLSVDVENAQ